ncbi:hypothetical protein G6F24_012794 [Rhizopus arrhizus]|nr:hypothetical protein G6F24_012794 [Rhizopus arrhizus]
MSGLKRLYGPEAIAEFTKSLLRVAFVGVAAGLVVWTGFDTLRGLIHHPLETAITDGLGFTLRLLLATGILGGYTTFSTYALEIGLLLQRGQHGLAALYAGGSVALGLAGLFGGMKLARLVLG